MQKRNRWLYALSRLIKGHVPIFLERMEHFETTQAFLSSILAIHAAEPVTSNTPQSVSSGRRRVRCEASVL